MYFLPELLTFAKELDIIIYYRIIGKTESWAKMKKKEAKPILRNMRGMLKGYKAAAILSPVTISLEVLLEVFIPILMATIVDGGLYQVDDFKLKPLFSPELIANRNRFVLVVGGIMVLAAMFSFVFGCLAARFSSVASMGLAKNLRSRLLGKIQDFSFANTDRFSTASLVMRCTTDVNSVQQTFQMMIRMLVRAPVMMVFALIMAISIDRKLAMVFLFAIPVLLIAVTSITLVGQKRFKTMLKKYDDMNAAVQEDLIAVREVKAFVRSDHEKKKFAKSAFDLRTSQIRAQKLFTLAGPIQMLVMWTCTIIVLAVGGDNIIYGRTSLHSGELISLVTYTNQVISSLMMVSFMVVGLARTAQSVNRINEVLDEEIDIADNDTDYTVDNGSIEFENVCFSYQKSADNLTLRDIDLSIASGETIGIVGGTGEGKSSLVNLIPRFYDVSSGSVKVSGRDVREYSLHNLRDGVSMVLQNGSLFSGTIADNLRWSDPDADDETVWEFCRAACADEFIEKFPDGMNTELGQGGVNLSGGQKQRLRIARALIKKPKILILDDSTSAVDTATDKRIREAMRKALPGTTKIIIAQRIASVIDADRIVVLDHGAISDVGSHDELMQRSEIYRDIYDSQMKGQEEGEQNAER